MKIIKRSGSEATFTVDKIIGAIKKAFRTNDVTDYCGLPWDKFPLCCDWVCGTYNSIPGVPDFVVRIDGAPVAFRYI